MDEKILRIPGTWKFQRPTRRKKIGQPAKACLFKYAARNKARDVMCEKAFRYALMIHRIHYQRQKVVHRYIVDFYLPKRNLIIEIDGPEHDLKKAYDQTREKFLTEAGFIVLRFTNKQVYDDLPGCMARVKEFPESYALLAQCHRKLRQLNQGFMLYPRKYVVRPKKTHSLHECVHGRLAKWCTACRYAK